ncbi:MAG: sigma-70 family RNA polymerase sigma factor [Sphingorhabdus sp.]|nr:sigma-70 family RNA polymerase sigma factor [Sphingorhabdus sp.]
MTADDNSNDIANAARARLSEALVRTGYGDRAAFETVYRATSAKLFGVCLRIFPDRNEAEEALQDAYLTIWNRASSFQTGRASPISWLVAVTRNRAIDRLRASGKAKFTALDDAMEIEDTAPRADTVLSAADDDKILHHCIQTLDQRDAHFIRSAFIGGATYSQLADAESAPLATVKSRIRRALLRLRACMEDEQ